METIRLSTWINAPEERCFRLATSTELHALLARAVSRKRPGGDGQRSLGVGDRLLWPGRYLGMNLNYATRIDQMRPFAFFHEVLDGGYFNHLEHEHHFTALNDGTRMRDELRFVAPARLLRPLVRRYLRLQIMLRNQILKEVAQSERWMRYLESSPERPGSASRGEAPQQRNDASPRVAAGRMAAHRG